MEIINKFLVFAADINGTILFISLKDLQDSWSFKVDWDFKVSSNKLDTYLDHKVEEECDNKKTLSQYEKREIQLIATNETTNLIAFTSNEKSLYVGRVINNSIKVLSRRYVNRAVCKIKIADNSKLILADKSGDCFEYDCIDFETPGKWIFSHMSQILDFVIPIGFRFIVTSDRDEKIRTTNYPATQEIEAYCMGHKEFVSSIAIFEHHSILLSVSGDKELRMWNYLTGKLYQVSSLPFVPINLVLMESTEKTGFFSLTDEDDIIHINTYVVNIESDIYSLKFVPVWQKSYSTNHYSVFEKNDNSLYVTYMHADELCVDKIYCCPQTNTVNVETIYNLKELIGIHLDNITFVKSFETSLLFKKKYDNVKDYHERKRQRIEKKLK
ncbi:unnamed protein product [Diamesa serratosioi]